MRERSARNAFQPLPFGGAFRRAVHLALCLALTLGARGGVYLCGGIIPRVLEYFKNSPFRSRFENKGRFEAYLAAIPVYVVLSEFPGITGAAAALDNHLKNV